MLKPSLPVLFCLWLLPAVSLQAQIAWEQASGPRLNQLAIRLADQPVALQTDLARIALEELSAVYSEEAQRARSDARRRPGKHDLPGWAAGVQQLAEDYAALAGTIQADTAVEFTIGPDQSLDLMVDGRLVVISTPRMNTQGSFEARIIQRFCELDPCDGLVENMPVPTAVQDKPVTSTEWQFSDKTGPTCSSGDGLEFQFRSMDNLDRKRLACSSVVSELHQLAGAIGAQTRSGLVVDWEALAVYQRPEPDRHKVVLNRAGEAVEMTLPWLAGHPDLLHKTVPWLAAHLRGESFTLVIINAEDALDSGAHQLDQ